jgi:CMP/dCMP kinase
MKITVTGQSGTGSTAVADLVAKKLGYTHASVGDFFREMATKMQMDIQTFDDYVREHPEYDLEIDKKQREFGTSNDNFVYESRLGWHFIPDSVKILITCNLEERIRRVAQKESVSEEEAKKHIEEREQVLVGRFASLHGVEDPLNPKHFDIVVDSSTDSSEVVVDKILASIKK